MAFRALVALDDNRALPFMRQVVASQSEPTYRLRAIRYLLDAGRPAVTGHAAAC